MIKLRLNLSKAFEFEGYAIQQAEEDADALIINTAITIAEKYQIKNAATGIDEYTKNVIVVGQDIDLLVLLSQLNSNNAPIYFLKCGAGNVIDMMYSSTSFKPDEYRSIVGLLHCFSGCDATSGFAGKGKKSTIDLLLKNTKLLELAKPF